MRTAFVPLWVWKQNHNAYWKEAWNIEVHDDGTISLSPSVGNFYLPCRSHYYIKHGKIKLC